ncbi:MAG TPA: hypothetical protein ENH84_01280 [Phycisphaerae bacterium]|nr:hypothetical protein [Phycisphaerae bacterium]
MAEIINLECVTRLDLPPDRILKAALDEGDLESVVILGYDSQGEEYFASSIADCGAVMWLMERLKLQLLGFDDDADNG